jgi:methionine synthase I (cobalamin-dependent)
LAGFVSDTNPDFLEPLGSLKPGEVYDGYKEQISALLEGGVDLIMIVGNHLEEKLIAIEVAKAISDKPVVAQNVFYQGATGFRTMMGLDPVEASARLENSAAEVVGASCGLMRREEDPYGYYEGATALVGQMRKGTGKILSIQPNAGMARLEEGRTVYPATAQEMAREVPRWIEAGARIVGGCCGTGLEHYRAIKPLVDVENARRNKEAHRNKEVH